MRAYDTREHSLHAPRLAVAAVREEEVCATRRAEVEAVDARHARVAQRELGRSPEVQLSVPHDVFAEPRAERIADVVAHLVAARPDRRTDRGGERTVVERLHRGLDDAVEQTAPAGVHDRDRRRAVARARECDRQAVGAHREDREVALLGPEPVAALAARTRERAMDERRVELVVQREPLGIGADLRARTTPVLVDTVDVVAGATAEVQRCERPVAHAADARREHDLVRAWHVPAEIRHTSCSLARSSSHSLLFRLGSSTTSSSSRDSTVPSSGPSR
jgi:hypothetical protein